MFDVHECIRETRFEPGMDRCPVATALRVAVKPIPLVGILKWVLEFCMVHGLWGTSENVPASSFDAHQLDTLPSADPEQKSHEPLHQ